MLCLDDLLVLSTPLSQEVLHHLPVPASVAFYALCHDGLSPIVQDRRGLEELEALASSVSVEPRLQDNQLIVPLRLPSAEIVAVVISEVDPPLLRRMAPSWLRELQDSLLERFAILRLVYIDPETGMYNRRAAIAFLQETAEGNRGCFYLIQVSFQRRTAAATSLKNKEIADLLPALTQGLCFSFGYGVFGVFRREQDREQALKTCHHLQHQLKREGMHKVQIGFSLALLSSGEREARFDRLWQALAMAEKRGPFGLCDIDSAMMEDCHPFPRVTADLHRRIRTFSRNRGGFFLAVLLFHDEACEPACETPWLDAILAGKGGRLGQEGRHLFLFFFGPGEQGVRQTIAEIDSACAQHLGVGAVSIGIASWPFLDCSKRDVVDNCLKALLHGSFLGPGSVVFFDHLSLNVSGDAFFEEGDYRSAIKEYRRGLQLRPGDVNLLNSLGVALVECNQERKASTCFRQVLVSEPKNSMALTNLGNVLHTLGEKSAALDCYERALGEFAENDVGKQELFLSTSKLYTDFGLHDKAASLLERWRAVAGNGRDFRMFRLLGQNYMEIGRVEEAMQACQRALQLFPRDSISLSILGLLYAEYGQGIDVGLSLCRKALELDTLNPDHWLRLSRALLHAGDPVGALPAIRRCLGLRYGHLEGVLHLGRVYQALGKIRRAEGCFRRVLARNDCTDRQAERARACLTALTPAEVP